MSVIPQLKKETKKQTKTPTNSNKTPIHIYENGQTLEH